MCLIRIATTVHEELGTCVKTVHSHYRLETTDLPNDSVVEHAIANNMSLRKGEGC